MRPPRTPTYSGVTPSGRMQLGNYLGAVRHWVDRQDLPGQEGGMYCVTNLHAFTLDSDPADVARWTTEMFALLLASGLDPRRSVVYVQGDVPAHTELAYLMECTASFGEMRRMTQFKEKSARGGAESVRLSLLTYPTLMAADILLYDTEEVPVGEDQAQHVELARRLAARFDHRYGPALVVPRLSVPDVAARVMNLRDATRKMSKSDRDGSGVVYLLDPPDVVSRKVRRAVTDPGSEVRHDPRTAPGVSNLLEILAAATGASPEEAARGVGSYAALKEATAEAVIEVLRPVQKRHAELTADPATLAGLRAEGAALAAERAAPTLRRVREAMGLVDSVV